jgi:hypothetical protein
MMVCGFDWAVAARGGRAQPLLLEVNTSPQLLYAPKFVGWVGAIDAMLEELVRRVVLPSLRGLPPLPPEGPRDSWLLVPPLPSNE